MLNNVFINIYIHTHIYIYYAQLTIKGGIGEEKIVTNVKF